MSIYKELGNNIISKLKEFGKRKYIAALLIPVVLLFAGCPYEEPLVKEHVIPVDSSVLGLWEPQPDEGEESGTNERMIILKFSDTEYLIHYPPGGNDEAYYRGYLIKIGGISCVQLQIIGTEEGMPKKDAKALFAVVSYELKSGILEIRTLNPDLVDDELKTTDALAQSFLNHKENKDLFINPVRFRRTSFFLESMPSIPY